MKSTAFSTVVVIAPTYKTSNTNNIRYFFVNGGSLRLIVLIKKFKIKGKVDLATQGNETTINARPITGGGLTHIR